MLNKCNIFQLFIIACIFLPLYNGTKSDYQEENGVIIATDDNFNDLITQNKYVLVKFYAPWCGHCKSLAPEYEKAAKQLKKHKPQILLAHLDATVHKITADAFSVQGYPTLKFFTDGTVSEYEGGREEDTIVEWLKAATQSQDEDPDFVDDGSIREKEGVIKGTEKNFDTVIANNKHVLVKFYSPGCGHCKELAPHFIKAAQEAKSLDPKISFMEVDATKYRTLAARFAITAYPDVKFFTQGSPTIEFDGSRTRLGIIKWLKKKTGTAAHQGDKSQQEKDKNYNMDLEFAKKDELKKASDLPGLDDGVIVGTDQNLQSILSNNRFVMVEYYAPWCGHCKQLAPQYKSAAALMAENDPKVLLVKVDATEHKIFAGKEGVAGFPTIKFYIDGFSIDYDDERTETAIIEWIKKRTSIQIAELSNLNELNIFKEQSDVSFIWFGPKTAQYSQFEKTCHVNTNVQCAVSESSSQHGISLFKKFDELQNDFTEPEISFEALSLFIVDHAFPSVMEGWSKLIEKKVFGTQNHIGMFLFYNRNDQPSQNAEADFEHLKNYFKGKILLVKTTLDGEGDKLGKEISISTNTLPQVWILGLVQKEISIRYKLNGVINTDSIKQFYNDFKENKLQIRIKSQEIPTSNDSPVMQLVGFNFDQIVYDKKKDVFVKFYSPNCGHCQQLAPIWEKLAQRLKEEGSEVIMAEIDLTSNDVKGHNINSFPTLKFFGRNFKNRPPLYSGDRSENDLYKFIQQKAFVKNVDQKKSEL